jgi:hypothetical protein
VSSQAPRWPVRATASADPQRRAIGGGARFPARDRNVDTQASSTGPERRGAGVHGPHHCFAGWLPRDTTRFRALHDTVKALQAAAVSPIALRDALYDVERAQEPLPGSAILTLLRHGIVELHDQLEASGLDAPSHGGTASPAVRYGPEPSGHAAVEDVYRLADRLYPERRGRVGDAALARSLAPFRPRWRCSPVSRPSGHVVIDTTSARRRRR